MNSYCRPLIPDANNFTPPSRTPWGGNVIMERYKQGLGVKSEGVVGESWEISGHPSFPNRFKGVDGKVKTLLEIEKEAAEVLYGGKHTAMPFMVKLLNSAGRLSVQVHPPHGMIPGKPSKTEAWIILAAEDGAGIYLGLKVGVTKKEFLKVMREGGDVSVYLNFVPVKTGDVFFIPSGTLHAIGEGITLLEPQETSETTFRAYDWGRVQPDGKPRQLHLDEVEQVTDWNGLRGEELIQSLRRVGAGGNPEIIVAVPEFTTVKVNVEAGEWFEGSTRETGVIGGVVTEGAVEVVWGEQRCEVRKGQSLILPAKLGDYRLRGKIASTLYLTWV